MSNEQQISVNTSECIGVLLEKKEYRMNLELNTNAYLTFKTTSPPLTKEERESLESEKTFFHNNKTNPAFNEAENSITCNEEKIKCGNKDNYKNSDVLSTSTPFTRKGSEKDEYRELIDYFQIDQQGTFYDEESGPFSEGAPLTPLPERYFQDEPSSSSPSRDASDDSMYEELFSKFAEEPQVNDIMDEDESGLLQRFCISQYSTNNWDSLGHVSCRWTPNPSAGNTPFSSTPSAHSSSADPKKPLNSISQSRSSPSLRFKRNRPRNPRHGSRSRPYPRKRVSNTSSSVGKQQQQRPSYYKQLPKIDSIVPLQIPRLLTQSPIAVSLLSLKPHPLYNFYPIKVDAANSRNTAAPRRYPKNNQFIRPVMMPTF